jgi:MoxR-like ATPase
MSTAQQTILSLQQNLQRVIKGKEQQINLVLTALFAGGHVLLEDNPGTGKTVLAKTLANSIGSGQFKRVQFTPDLLPMDLLGAFIFDDNAKDFLFKKGPIFCNVLLADEINRASPKVQSALLEAMAEQQITMGDTTHKLEKLFFTIATQNPVETEGTYPLPAAQLDRFFIKASMGYAHTEAEQEILNSYTTIKKNTENTQAVVNINDVAEVQQAVEQVFVHQYLIEGVSRILEATRNHQGISLGASTRAGIALLQCMRAYALIKDRNFTTEDDLKFLAHAVLQHRLEFRSKDAQQNALTEIINSTMQFLVQQKPK